MALSACWFFSVWVPAAVMTGHSDTQQRDEDLIISTGPCKASFHEGLPLNLINILTHEILSDELMLQSSSTLKTSLMKSV